MISSDKNIETIAQLAESLKHYVGVQSEYVKLSFAAAYALAPMTGTVGAFCIVAGFYLLLLILFVFNRRKWVEKPLVRFLADLLLNS